MQLKDMTAVAVMQVIDQQHPNWWLAWADQMDLKDALRLNGAEAQRSLLRARVFHKVELVLRATYILEKQNA